MDYDIKDVAIYLRKSRDESNGTEDVLIKHETELVNYAKSRGFKTIIYKEIGSADSIEYRTEMKRLLSDVEQDLFDAVLVVDFDRLSRGSMEDTGKIQRIFKDSNTLILTPSKVYDLNDEGGELISEVESLLARNEYRAIKKRLNRGKKTGAKLGNWTNGRPPFPYFYDRESKSIKVDELKRPIYDRIKNDFLAGKPAADISFELNRESIPSPSGSIWHENTVRRLLLNEIHLGKVIYGKTEGGAHKNRNIKPLRIKPRDEWIVAEGNHERLKTNEEHGRIISSFTKRKVTPVASRRGAYILSGLVYCGLCGKSHQFTIKSNGDIYVRKCQKPDAFGNRCKNRGINVNVLYKAIDTALSNYEDEILNTKDKPDEERMQLVASVQSLEVQLDKLKEGLERIKSLYIDGIINREEMKTKTEEQNRKIQRVQAEIDSLKSSLGYISNISREEKFQQITEFKRNFDPNSQDPQSMNRLAKTIIDKIVFTREGDNAINIDVKFI
jgi:site-specific DNA recombinase